MNPTEPSAEEALRAAFDPVPEAVESDPTERRSRLNNGLKAQTATQDLCHLLVDNAVAVLGWISLTLLILALPKPKNPTINENHHDDHQ